MNSRVMNSYQNVYLNVVRGIGEIKIRIAIEGGRTEIAVTG